MVAVCAVLHRRVGEVQPPAFPMSVTEVLGSLLGGCGNESTNCVVRSRLAWELPCSPFSGLVDVDTLHQDVGHCGNHVLQHCTRGEHTLHIQQHRSVPFTTVGRTSKRSIQHECSRVKGEEKIARSLLACPGSIGSASRRMFFSKKNRSACLPYFFASLKLLAVARTLVTSRPHRFPEEPAISLLFEHL